MNKYTLAIIGSGSLGSTIGRVVAREMSEEYEILGVLSRRIENARKLAGEIGARAYKTLGGIIDDNPDYVIEAASPEVVKDKGIEILANGINLIPLSVGALADEEFYDKVKETALENNGRLYIPPGAVGGFDVLRASMLMEDGKVSITTEKPPESLERAPFLKNRALSKEKKVEVFSGFAKEAIQHFPKNVNVAVATALATTGVENTNAFINSILGSKSNKHTIKLMAKTVNVTITVESTPSEDNPKSSTLAAYSVIGLLKNLTAPITF